MSLLDHAKQELMALGYDLNDKEEGPNKWIMEKLFELLEVFLKQSHSGFSGPYLIDLFSKVARYEPASPLTGKEDEWCLLEYGHDPKWQSKRCPHVFKDADGRAYDSEGKIFRKSNGLFHINRDSRVYITFPYTPKRECVDVPSPKEE